jgi:hypothetical protein
MEGILLSHFWPHRRIVLSLLIWIFVLPQALAGPQRGLASDPQIGSQGVELDPLPALVVKLLPELGPLYSFIPNPVDWLAKWI